MTFVARFVPSISCSAGEAERGGGRQAAAAVRPSYLGVNWSKTVQNTLFCTSRGVAIGRNRQEVVIEPYGCITKSGKSMILVWEVALHGFNRPPWNPSLVQVVGMKAH